MIVATAIVPFTMSSYYTITKVLNDDQENRKLVSKLPKWAIDSWSCVVHQSKTEKCTFPPFSEFVKFLSREADIACDPVISSQSLKEDDSKNQTMLMDVARLSLDIEEEPLV